MTKLIELHILHSFPVSNLNRDQDGLPKECFVGGVRRARVSSQSWNRVIRDRLKKEFAELQLQVTDRSKRHNLDIAQHLHRIYQEAGNPIELAEAQKRTNKHLTDAGYKTKDDEDAGETTLTTLLMITPAQQKAIAEAIYQEETQPKPESKTKGKSKTAEPALPTLKDRINHLIREIPLDLAVFGRMITSDPTLSVDKGMHVAHALSTHESEPEFDYYSAVDELSTQDSGAGMLGDTAYQSATYYRYLLIDLPQLRENLSTLDEPQQHTLLKLAIQHYLQAFLTEIPSGKKASFAPYTQPSYVLATISPSGNANNLFNAFEKPVQATRDGHLTPSILRLNQQLHSHHARGFSHATHAYVLNNHPASPQTTSPEETSLPLTPVTTVGELVSLVVGHL